MRSTSILCVLPLTALSLTIACSGVSKTDHRAQDESAAAGGDFNLSTTATSSPTATPTPTPAYCPPDPNELSYFSNANLLLVEQYSGLAAITAGDFGGYRVKAMTDITSAQTQISQAVAYVEQHGDCAKPTGSTTQVPRNPLKLPVNAGDDAKVLYTIGGQLVAVENLLNVSITERDFNGHRAQAALDVSQALSALQTAIDYQACEEVPAHAFSDVAKNLTAIQTALGGIAQGDFGGWKVKAIADLATAQAMVTRAAAVNQSECAKPDQSNDQPLSDPLKLPTKPGVATPTIVAQADQLTKAINELNVTIVERDFNGLRAAAATDLLIVLADLQNAVIYEACQEGSKDAACAIVKPAQ